MTDSSVTDGVEVRRENVSFPTYRPCAPDVNPMFIEKRVYQGSSGRVYPLPFYDRIAESPTPCDWSGVWLENKYIKLLILPQIGGRIHIGQDKTNGYHFFYRQQVIKPALVGLAGPWISGGVEFNWPQHHRPSTFMPADVHVEQHSDGSKTVWLSEHEPMNRMKGMHGVCLHPDRNYIQLKVRLYNRTQSVQTFLWWANVATRVHDQYQSFFPPDVHYVADHAKRAMSEFPECRGLYYGVDYRPGTRLDWYKNIPVPTSYMCMGTQDDFFGGYDHGQRAGVVHVANHHISPGKKQWTWGNHEFGYAWDRNLTDEDGPYIELMAGVYTDNQPDFSFLHPGETRTFSQYWYPIREVGPACHANLHAAVRLSVANGACSLGVAVTGAYPSAQVLLTLNAQDSETQTSGKPRVLLQSVVDLEPARPFTADVAVPEGVDETGVTLTVNGADGVPLVVYTPQGRPKGEVPDPATEPPAPSEVHSTDELYVTGLHLEQYRHATREPQLYWMEALRRDPGDSRCNNAMGLWHFKRGEFSQAQQYFRSAIGRLTLRNPNPFDGEVYYNLGMCLRYMDHVDEAYAALYKSTWNYAWQSPAFYALAQIDCTKQNWSAALDHLDRALRVNVDFLQARNLRAIVLERLAHKGPGAKGSHCNGQPNGTLKLTSDEARSYVEATLKLDPLDWWSRCLLGQDLTCDNHTLLDISLDYAAAGMFQEAAALLEHAAQDVKDGTLPSVSYYRAYFFSKMGDVSAMSTCLAQAAAAPHDYCFPARLQEIHILQHAVENNTQDARSRYYLGNLLYDRRRYQEAIAMWEQSAQLHNSFSIVWRNLGIAYFNVQKSPSASRDAYDKAVAANPADARVLFERDQLWKRLAVAPQERLAQLKGDMELCMTRDDLAAEICALHLQLCDYQSALDIVTSRRWQPWEGGEGTVLGLHVRTHLSLGRQSLSAGDGGSAVEHFCAALDAPQHNLGEAKHLLANYSHVYYWQGKGQAAAGDEEAARKAWETAAQFQGDFQSMAVCPYSEMTLFSALSLKELGKDEEAEKLLRKVLEYAEGLERTEAKIDYFATSLPTMLLFDDDLTARQVTKALFIQAQALWGLGQTQKARELLHQVLSRDPSHDMAADLMAELNESSP